MQDQQRKLLRLRRDDVCAQCGIACTPGTEAWWFREERVVRCRACVEGAELARTLAGKPGGSAIGESERRRSRRQHRLRSRFGRLAPFVEAVSDDPQNIRAWEEGGDSERRVGEFLDNELGVNAYVLHDRRVPGTRANIDHVVVASSGIWVIDSKARKGKVGWRDIGPFWRTELRLVVNGRDGSRLIIAITRQVAVVANALGGEAREIPIRGALCFNGASWGLRPHAFRIDGVLVTFPGDLVKRIQESGPLDESTAGWVAAQVATTLPPAGARSR